jgi:hypothetical protein
MSAFEVHTVLEDLTKLVKGLFKTSSKQQKRAPIVTTEAKAAEKKKRLGPGERRQKLYETLLENVEQRTEDLAKRFGVSDHFGERRFLMKQSEAVQHLREMMWGLQKYRSITMETLGSKPPGPHSISDPRACELHLSEKLAGEMFPWVFGEKCPLPVLSKILDDVDSGGDLAPGDYYNMMVILDRFMPEVRLSVVVARGTDSTLPQGPPDVSIMMGWDEE